MLLHVIFWTTQFDGAVTVKVENACVPRYHTTWVSHLQESVQYAPEYLMHTQHTTRHKTYHFGSPFLHFCWDLSSDSFSSSWWHSSCSMFVTSVWPNILLHFWRLMLISQVLLAVPRQHCFQCCFQIASTIPSVAPGSTSSCPESHFWCRLPVSFPSTSTNGWVSIPFSP